jgi:hypothetical protein
MNVMIKYLNIVQQLDLSNLTPKQHKQFPRVSSFGIDKIHDRGIIKDVVDLTSSGLDMRLKLVRFLLEYSFLTSFTF